MIDSVGLLVQIKLESHSVLFVDGRAISVSELCRDPAPEGVKDVRVVAVYPENGRSVKDCIYAMTRAEVENLIG